MSADASGWSWRHSPYKGERLLVHLAIADVVNDAHENEFWMSTAALAGKAKCSRSTVTTTLADMLERGLLEVVERATGRGRSTVYRFLMPPGESGRVAGTSPPAKPRAPRPKVRVPRPKPRATPEPSPHTEQKEPNEEPAELTLDAGSEKKPLEAIERRIARRVFERKEPRPAGKHAFPSAMTVARALLEVGWKPEQIEDAMVAARTISIGACEIELNKAHPRPTPIARTVDTDRDTPGGRIQL